MSESSKGELQMKDIRKILAIAGFDPSGGAGLQADIKVITAHKMYAMGAVTALTVQNTTGIREVMELPAPFVASQLEAIFEDIQPDAVKIGMVSSTALIRVIAEKLNAYAANNIVVDPVMVATSGDRLISADAVEALCKELLPRAAIITPNIPEVEIMIGREITDAAGMEQAAVMIYERFRAAVLMKGGHHVDDANDLLVDDKGARWFRGRRIATENTHGTGCTLSSAIASNLAQGMDLDTAVARAKEYLSGALAAGLNLGKGHGPMAHTFDLRSTFIHQQRAHL